MIRRIFQNMNFGELSQTLKFLPGQVRLRAFRRHPLRKFNF